MRHPVLPLLAPLLVLAASASPAAADPLANGLFRWTVPMTTDPVVPVRQSRQLSPREAVQIINARVPGRPYDVREEMQNGRLVYVIRWEPSDENARGRIIIFVVDAETGAILSQRG